MLQNEDGERSYLNVHGHDWSVLVRKGRVKSGRALKKLPAHPTQSESPEKRSQRFA